MNHDLIIFDLDGTLADSFPFFVSVHNLLADRHGFRRLEADEIEALRGHSPRELMHHARLPRWKLPFVARSFMKLMRDADVQLFDGVGEALQALHASGVLLALVSSNAEDNCRRILGAVHWRRFAHTECGVSIFGKAKRIARVLDATGTPPWRALYVGDQITDAEAAHAAGVDFGAVAWGYATARSLRRGHPTHVFSDVGELVMLGRAAGRSRPAEVQ